MSLHERTFDVIQSFYDAAMDESLWCGALEGLCGITASQAASFWVLDGSEEPRLPTFICINFDMSSIKEYLEHTAAIDPTVQYLVSHPREPIVHDGLVITEREKDKHPYYDWHNRRIDTRFRMVGQVRMAPKVQAGVALHRTRKAGRYEPRDIDRFSVLHRHLERALAIGFRLSTLGAMQRASAEWFDRSSAAVFFLDEHKRIVYSNRAAQELVSAKDGITLRGEGVVLARKQDDDKFQGLISQAISPIVSAGDSRGGAIRAPRATGKRPYGIIVSPVSGDYPLLSGLRPAVCVVITDPDRKKTLPNHRLRIAFGLTEAEARLASELAGGEDLRTAAGKLEITYGTARSRLAQIFQKTDTRRQGELIRLLLATLAVE
jgi:DNA-binding CsgD family transcriptional regulator/PAS domain-containing protein